MNILKKSILVLLSIVIISCDPMKETFDKLEQDPQPIVNDLVYTMTEDDYETAGQSFPNFSSEDQAKEGIPLVLTANFPQLGQGSSANVTYNIYNGSSPDLRGENIVTTVTTQDYDDLGYSFPNFSSDYAPDVEEWANFKYPDGEDGDHIDVTFDFYDGSVNTVTGRVVFTEALMWKYTFVLPDEAYGDFFGESGIDFSNQDEGKEKMPVYLNFLIANGSDYTTLTTEAGASMVVQYNFDDRCFGEGCEDPGEPNVPAVALYFYDGLEWIEYSEGYQVTEASLQLGHDGDTWVPDNTIKYSMSADDYAFVVTEYADVNSAGAASMDQFGNYDITIWSADEIESSIADVLMNNFGGAEEGQKYLVSYRVWTGSAGDVYTLLMIKSGDTYVPVEG